MYVFIEQSPIATCLLYLSNKGPWQHVSCIYRTNLQITDQSEYLTVHSYLSYDIPFDIYKYITRSMICIVIVGIHFIRNKIMGDNNRIILITHVNDNLWLFYISFKEQKYGSYLH